MVRELWPQLQRKIPGLFEAVEKIEPSLQHGDFWYGNTAENEEGPGIVGTSLFFFLMLWQLKAHIRIEDQNDGHRRQIIFIEAHCHYSVSNSYYSPIPLVIFDPASFYGHHEFDLAGATLFGGFTREFFDAYHRLMPKAPGFGGRQKLYQLFHCLCVW